MSASGSPPEPDPPSRRGWQLPDEPAAGGVPGPPAYSEPRYEERPRESPPPPQGSPAPTTLPGSTAGLARAVNVASVPGANGTQSTVVTFRLEQYDPRAGRTGVVTVRMFGEDAIGFVAEGDWVEVSGKTKRGFITANRAVNHTSHAQYSAAGQGCAKIATLIAFSLIVLFILGIGVSILLSVLANR